MVVMRNIIRFFIFLLFLLDAKAEAPQPIKLQCTGILYYNDDEDEELRKMDLTKIYFEMSKSQAKVLGANEFSGTYSFVVAQENGYGLRSDSNNLMSGFIDRINGDLSLHEKIEAKTGKIVRRILNAKCSKYMPIF